MAALLENFRHKKEKEEGFVHLMCDWTDLRLMNKAFAQSPPVVLRCASGCREPRPPLGPRPSPGIALRMTVLDCGEGRGVRSAQNMQAGPCIPAGRTVGKFLC